MKIEVSIGEIVDKTTILEIKMEEIKDSDKRILVEKEYNYLKNVLEDVCNISLRSKEFTSLKEINRKLWDIENKIREKEFKQEFDLEFIELARSVYKTNDIRAQKKLEINLSLKSRFVEVKSY